MSLKLIDLEIKGLKCYEDSGIIPFHDLTVFIGENDAGKSTIFDALEYFLENKNLPSELYRDDKDIIEITCKFSVSTIIENLENYIINETIKIKKTFIKNTTFMVEILGEVFVDDDFNTYNNMNAGDLKALLSRLEIEPKSNQDLRREAIKEYLDTNNPEKENKFSEVSWKRISNYLPIFQRYSSSDYGNPTSLIRKTLELVYRESFYEQQRKERKERKVSREMCQKRKVSGDNDNLFLKEFNTLRCI